MNTLRLSAYRRGSERFGQDYEAVMEKIQVGVDTLTTTVGAFKTIFSPTQKAATGYNTGSPTTVVYGAEPKRGIPVMVYVAGAVLIGGIGFLALRRR